MTPQTCAHCPAPLTRHSAQPKRWSEAEDRLITLHYPRLGRHGMVPLLPGRAPDSIATRASKLRVRQAKVVRFNSYSEAEDAILREWWPKGGIIACAPRLPGRSRGAIKTRAISLGLRHYAYKRAKKPKLIQLPPRKFTFEEQLARVAAGEVGLTTAQHFPFRATTHHQSLAGASPL